MIFFILSLLSMKEMFALDQIQVNSEVTNKSPRGCMVPVLKSTQYLSTRCAEDNYCVLESGHEVPGSGTVVSLKCLDSYMLRHEQLDFVVCYDGAWYPEKHSCLKSCKARNFENIDASCSHNGNTVACDKNVRIGTKLEWKCKPGFQTNIENRHDSCMKNGTWQFSIPHCTAENRPVSVKIELFGQLSSKQQTIRACDQILISCYVNGYPTPTIAWLKNGQLIKAGGRILMDMSHSGNYTLSIDRSTLADSGAYQCKAENDHSTATDYVNIKVLQDASVKIYNIRNKITMETGKNVTVFCKVIANRLPIKVEWFKSIKSSRPLHKSDKISSIKKSNNCSSIEIPWGCSIAYKCVSQLLIKEAKLNDSGEYTCKASIYKISDKFRMEISVQNYLNVSAEIKLLGNLWENKTTIRACSRILLSCLVRGSPTPTVAWFKNGQPIKDRDRIKMIRNHPGNYTLFIEKSTLADSGTYLCQAKNDHSNATDFKDVKVFQDAVISVYKFRNEIFPAFGSNFKIFCNVIANQLPITVRWFKSSQQLKPGNRINLINSNDDICNAVSWGENVSCPTVYKCESQLLIRRADSRDSGEYTCEAMIGNSSDRFEIKISVYTPENVPAKNEMTKTKFQARDGDSV